MLFNLTVARHMREGLLLFGIAILSTGVLPTQASWQENGLPVAPVVAPEPYLPSFTSDGAGGAIVTWSDARSGNFDIYVQRVDVDGVTLWTLNGILISTNPGNQVLPDITSDGAGGAIVTWSDEGSGSDAHDVFAQRVDANGTILWKAGGVEICTAPGSQTIPRIVPDGVGGAIISWRDHRSGGENHDIYAQRIDASGTVLWIADGVGVCTNFADQSWPDLAPDGAGGAIIAWPDVRSQDATIYAQRVDASGEIRWTSCGVAICTFTGAQSAMAITSDAAGGAIITWRDARNGTENQDIYAQRIDANGSVQWSAEGLGICTDTGDQAWPRIAPDGAGGAVITWEDARRGIANPDIYAQRVDASGAVRWTMDGLQICTEDDYQYWPDITADGGGGAIIMWLDERSFSPSTFVREIYAQRVNASGIVQWTAGGVRISSDTERQMPRITSDAAEGAIITWLTADRKGIGAQRVDATGLVQWTTDGIKVCKATGPQEKPGITSDGAGGAIITWSDNRGADADIYAQRVDTNGIVQWSADAVEICTASGHQKESQIIADGLGGAIITWGDNRGADRDIYAQRVDTSGFVQWVANGIGICTESGFQRDPKITTDGAGGAIITWMDNRSSEGPDIYAQRVDANGNLRWAPGGVGIDTRLGRDRLDLQITADGSGGAIILWTDDTGDVDLYAQRVNANGTVQWPIDGIIIGVGSDGPSQITSDGSGGAFITWSRNSGGEYDILVQRVDGGGSIQWAADGVAACAATGDQQFPQLTSDGAGGAIVAWQDFRGGNNVIYAQRVDSGGNVLWKLDGVALCTEACFQIRPQITSDSAGGIIATWVDRRGGFGNSDVYVQRVDGNGLIRWTPGGVRVCAATGNQSEARIVSDGAGGAIVTWEDNRGTQTAVYTDWVASCPFSASAGSDLDGDGIDDACDLCPGDPSNGCDPSRSGSGLIGPGGGTLSTSDGSVTITIPAGALTEDTSVSITDSGLGELFELTTSSGNGIAVFAVGIEPEGTVFNVPVNIRFAWPDDDNDGRVDGTSIREVNLQVVKDGVAVTGPCKDEPGTCNTVANIFDVQVNSLSDFAVFAPTETVAIDIKPGSVVNPLNCWNDHGVIPVAILTTEDFDATVVDHMTVAFGPGEAREIHGLRHEEDVDGDQDIDLVFHFSKKEALLTCDHLQAELTGETFDGIHITGVDEVRMLEGGYEMLAPAGRDVTLRAGDAVQIAFANVLEAGITEVFIAEFDPGLPTGFRLATEPPFICEISTEVEFEGSIDICVSTADHVLLGDHENLSLLQLDKSTLATGWVAITNPVQPNDGWVCGHTTHLSQPIVLALPEAPSTVEDRDLIIPKTFRLHANIPNPFNPLTTIRYDLPERSQVRLRVYDVAGRLVRVLENSLREPGTYQTLWDGLDEEGHNMPSGVYFYEIFAGRFLDVRKMILLR